MLSNFLFTILRLPSSIYFFPSVLKWQKQGSDLGLWTKLKTSLKDSLVFSHDQRPIKNIGTTSTLNVIRFLPCNANFFIYYQNTQKNYSALKYFVIEFIPDTMTGNFSVALLEIFTFSFQSRLRDFIKNCGAELNSIQLEILNNSKLP